MDDWPLEGYCCRWCVDGVTVDIVLMDVNFIDVIEESIFNH